MNLIQLRNEYLAAIHSAMLADSGLWFINADMGSVVIDDIAKCSNYRNVGIAENLAFNVALGLGLCGKTVVVYGIAAFLIYRGLDGLRHIAMHNKLQPMNICILAVGADNGYDMEGESHVCRHGKTFAAALGWDVYDLRSGRSPPALTARDFLLAGGIRYTTV